MVVPTFEQRFAAVLAHIDAHTGDAFSLTTLSAIAAYSPCHFHRQFGAIVGVRLHQYLLLSRLKQASYLLAFRPALPVGEIAARSGYEGPEAFARAFLKVVGVTPSEFRARPDWVDWGRRFESFLIARSRIMPAEPHVTDVTIVDFPSTRVGFLEHRGDPRRLNETIARLIAWRRRNGLPPSRSATFNVFFDDPETTPPEDVRIGLCAATDREIAPNEEGVVPLTLPGGPCALLRHVGSDDLLESAVRYLYARWLPQSGREPRDFPLFVQRVAFYPDVTEAEAVTDIFLPLRD